MPDLTKWKERLEKLFTPERRLQLILAAGIVGMVLLLLSQFADTLGGSKKEAEPQNPATAQYTTYSAEEYAALLEERLLNLITNIEGVGQAQVMVTLEQGVEYIYAQEEKSSLDSTRSGQDDTHSTYRQDVQYSYVLVDTEYGKKQALVRTQLQPKVQGVVIACEGADDIRVEQTLINVVTTALNLTTTRVCVVKINV